MLILSIIILSLLGTTLFGYFAHKFLHYKFMGRFSKSHEVHHNELYPITDFKSDKYRGAGKDSTVIFFTITTIPIISSIILLMLVGILSLFQMLLTIATMLFFGWLHDYIHDAFHINNHWLNKIPLINKHFQRLENLHYLHHVDELKNFGIYTFIWDKIFRTFKNN